MDNGYYNTPNDIENQPTPLVNSMRRELDNLPPLPSNCCIYRVPKRLRLVNEKAYTPQVVSIGPLHHGKESLKPMEEHKKRFLKDYLTRTKASLEHFVRIVKQNEAKLRDCYAEPIGFTSDEFVKIILVDAAFIIEVFLRNSEARQNDHDRIFNKPWMLQDIWSDLRVLENQLPFFILEDLFNSKRIPFTSDESENISMLKLSHKFFKKLIPEDNLERNSERNSSSQVEHFVGFLRDLYLPPQPRSRAGGKLKTLTIPTMTELHRAGVKFKVGSSKNLFDIRFSNGVLEIPKLTISDETELTIRNFLAFEQCYCPDGYINDYVVIMDRLVDTPKDVDLLVEYGIVENMLGDSKEGSQLINKLADGVTLDSDDFYFATLSEDLHVYNKTSWHKWKANLRQNYFDTPWTIVSVIAAVLLIILTVIQAVCSVISVTNDGSSHH